MMRQRLMRRSNGCLLAPAALVAGIAVLTGCGSGASSDRAVRAPPRASAAVVAGSRPSASALMICGPEIRSAVVGTLQLRRAPRITSSWAGRLYTCVYHLAAGPIALSVKESSSPAAAASYFATERRRLAAGRPFTELREVGYAAGDGSLVILKDSKTLRVDVGGLPCHVGPSSLPRSVLAADLAVAIMGCWNGT